MRESMVKAMNREITNSIVITGLRKSYERSPGSDAAYAIDGISFDVPKGQFVTLLGPSGCGKTTTLRCIAGLEHATEGRIEMGGEVVFDAQEKRHIKPEERPIAMVPQSYGIWPHMRVVDNAAFPMRHGRHRRKGPEVRQRALEMLEQVGLAGMADRWATQLSGGQQQRLALARALLGDPEVLLLDEPLSNLDAKLRAKLRQELRSFQEQFGVTSLYVTHDQAEALAMSDTVVVMNKGRVEQIDRPERLYDYPRSSFVADFIGSANLFPVRDASPGRGERCSPRRTSGPCSVPVPPPVRTCSPTTVDSSACAPRTSRCDQAAQARRRLRTSSPQWWSPRSSSVTGSNSLSGRRAFPSPCPREPACGAIRAWRSSCDSTRPPPAISRADRRLVC